MYAKYNINVWIMEIAEFNRMIYQAMKHFKQIVVIPAVIFAQITAKIIEYPQIRRQVAPGKYEEIPIREIEYPQIM